MTELDVGATIVEKIVRGENERGSGVLVYKTDTQQIEYFLIDELKGEVNEICAEALSEHGNTHNIIVECSVDKFCVFILPKHICVNLNASASMKMPNLPIWDMIRLTACEEYVSYSR